MFGHFIQTVVRPTDAAGHPVAGQRDYSTPPGNTIRARLVSPMLPYVLMFVLCYAGVYLLYKGVAGFLEEPRKPPSVVLEDVLGLSGVLASVIVCARMPRLTKIWHWRALGFLLLFAAGEVYYLVVSEHTQLILGSWITSPEIPYAEEWATGGLLAVALVVATAAWFFGRWSALIGGTKMLVVMGGFAIVFIVANAYHHHRLVCRSGECLGPVWPLLLASAAFLYLWWLAALIFDLTFVWHRYIRNSVIEDRLRELTPR